MTKILVNAWKCPDGTILQSRHRHDFVSYMDAEGRSYFVDGGTEYQRISGEGMEFVGCYDTDPHEKIREILSWGSYGRKTGNMVLTREYEAGVDGGYIQYQQQRQLSKIVQTKTQVLV